MFNEYDEKRRNPKTVDQMLVELSGDDEDGSNTYFATKVIPLLPRNKIDPILKKYGFVVKGYKIQKDTELGTFIEILADINKKQTRIAFYGSYMQPNDGEYNVFFSFKGGSAGQEDDHDRLTYDPNKDAKNILSSLDDLASDWSTFANESKDEVPDSASDEKDTNSVVFDARPEYKEESEEDETETKRFAAANYTDHDKFLKDWTKEALKIVNDFGAKTSLERAAKKLKGVSSMQLLYLLGDTGDFETDKIAKRYGYFGGKIHDGYFGLNIPEYISKKYGLDEVDKQLLSRVSEFLIHGLKKKFMTPKGEKEFNEAVDDYAEGENPKHKNRTKADDYAEGEKPKRKSNFDKEICMKSDEYVNGNKCGRDNSGKFKAESFDDEKNENTIKLDKELYEWVKTKAKQQHRSVSRVIRSLIAKA
jgi:hypothetical protein